MASKNKALALAQSLLTPQNIHIAEQIVQSHVDTALSAKNKARLAELFALIAMIEDVKAEAKA